MFVYLFIFQIILKSQVLSCFEVLSDEDGTSFFLRSTPGQAMWAVERSKQCNFSQHFKRA